MSQRELPQGIQQEIELRKQFALELIQDIATMQQQEDGKEMSAAVEWVPYKGPEGGEGWENVITGERRYQKEKPTDIADLPEPKEPEYTIDLVGETYTFDDIPEGTRLEVPYTDEHVFVQSIAGGDGMPPIIYAIGTSGQKYSVEPRDVIDFGTPDPEYQREYSPEEFESMSTDAQLLESFKTATEVKSFRESGGEGGSNNGDVLQVLEQPDGSTDFAIPVEHIYENSTHQAMMGNLVAHSLLASLGVRGVRTAVTTDATGVEYLVKDGADGLPGTMVQPNNIGGSEELRRFMAEDRVAMLFAGWMLGNTDLHGGNYFFEGMPKEDDPRGHIIIDHDFSWMGEGIFNAYHKQSIRTETQGALSRYVETAKNILTDSDQPQDAENPGLHSEGRRIVARGVARVLNNYADGIEGYYDEVLHYDEAKTVDAIDYDGKFYEGMEQVAKAAASEMSMLYNMDQFTDMLSDKARELFAEELKP